MVKACFLGDGREWFWDHGTFGSWESPKQREQSFWAILYRHIYIYIGGDVPFFWGLPGTFFNVQLPQMGDSPAARFTTLLAFLWALVVMRTAPNLGSTQFSNSPSHFFDPRWPTGYPDIHWLMTSMTHLYIYIIYTYICIYMYIYINV